MRSRTKTTVRRRSLSLLSAGSANTTGRARVCDTALRCISGCRNARCALAMEPLTRRHTHTHTRARARARARRRSAFDGLPMCRGTYVHARTYVELFNLRPPLFSREVYRGSVSIELNRSVKASI